MHLLILGNNLSPRIKYLTKTLKKIHWNNYEVLEYNGLIDSPELINRYIQRGTVIRLEAPGQDYSVTKKLIQKGASFNTRKNHFIPDSVVPKLIEDKGKIEYPWQWFLGYEFFLNEIQSIIKANPHKPVFMNHPSNILPQFNKPQCQKILASHQIPVPAVFPSFNHFDEFTFNFMNQSPLSLFIKLPASSSASGIAAYYRDSKEEYIITTMEMKRKNNQVNIYNSRKIRKYRTQEEIKDLIHWFSKENAHVEQWLPKKKCQGQEFDLRLVVIQGKIYHGIMRLSNSPFTNLHLGNTRIKLTPQIKKTLPWKKIQEICQEISKIFPQSFYFGVDVMVNPENKPFVLEINPFGDHLNGIYYNKENTYQTELRLFKESFHDL